MAKRTGGKRATVTGFIESSADLYAFEREEIERRRRISGRASVERSLEPELKVAGDLTGLALSGGGVRSAATCLGAIQALHVHGRLKGFDYLSTVSGGGYIGARLSIALAAAGGKTYPFGEDVSDSPAVSHLRDYSNYLMPRSRSLSTNLADGAVIVIRGLIANAICVLAFLLPIAMVSAWLFDRWPKGGGLLGFLFDDIRSSGWVSVLVSYIALNLLLLLLLALGAWAALRAFPRLDEVTSDTDSTLLRVARRLLQIAPLILFIELQPVAVELIDQFPAMLAEQAKIIVAFAVPASGVIATFASTLGNFLKRSEHQPGRTVAARRWLAKLLLYVGAAILPLLLWFAYLVLTDRLMENRGLWTPVLIIYAVCFALIWFMRPNGYSLHGFYRDRLSKAFLIDAPARGTGSRKPRLSDLKDSEGPYPLINAALNIQGSLKANQRGREADFFVFTPDYIGSQLTGYAPTAGPEGYEAIDSRIDLGSAIAISGAAVSANMGSHTVRPLSPTLSPSMCVLAIGSRIRVPFPVPRAGRHG